MDCKLNLYVEDISAVVGFLNIVGFNRPFSPDEILSMDEIIGKLSLSMSHDEYKPHVKVFGDKYEDVYTKARQHVKYCKSCNGHYRELISGVVGLINGSDRTIPTDAEFFEEEKRDLDSIWLGILYEDID